MSYKLFEYFAAILAVKYAHARFSCPKFLAMNNDLKVCLSGHIGYFKKVSMYFHLAYSISSLILTHASVLLEDGSEAFDGNTMCCFSFCFR